jgi:PAS domain S-box-containing protein
MRTPGTHFRESRELQELVDFFDNAPVPICCIGPDGTIRWANQAELDLLGYARPDYIGHSIAEFHADRGAWENMLRRLQNGEELHGCGARLRCRDGTIKHVLIDANAKWQDGQLIHIRCFTRAVTGPERAEETARSLMEVGTDYTCVARFNGHEVTLESASEGFTQITGYTVEEFNAHAGAFAVHPDDLLGVLASFEGLTRGETVGGEVRVLTKSGDVRWLRYRAEPSPDPGGLPGLWIRGAARDITEQKEAGQRVQEAERRFRQLAENINEVFWMSDPLRTQILYCSPAYEQVWGRSCDSLYQQPWSWLDSVVPEDRERFVAALDSQGRGEPTDIEYRILRPDGSVRWIRDRSFPVNELLGSVHRVAGVADDITEQKEAEQALQEADRRKDEFLAMLAHELRNPLAPIRNAMQILRAQGPSIPELQWARDVIDRQVRQMTRLVDDLLDISRITRGKVELRKERIELTAVLNSAVEASRPLIEKWGHELTVTVPREPMFLEADLTRLSQVVLNLLNNAAKYTDRGGHIWLTAEREGHHVLIRVKDNGIGIPPDMLPRIFEMFVQVDSSLDRAQGGLGIGLTLVQRLVKMHGGTITASSAGRGKGSEFVIRLPLAIDREQRSILDATESGQVPPAAPRRILVVDDNKDAADSLGMLLRLMGHEVHIAYDGLEAVGAAAAFEPQVVLLDIGLPKINGHETARRIRDQHRGRDMLLIALTGWGQEEDRSRSREAGFDYHLTKPIEFAALQQFLATLGELPKPCSV